MPCWAMRSWMHGAGQHGVDQVDSEEASSARTSGPADHPSPATLPHALSHRMTSMRMTLWWMRTRRRRTGAGRCASSRATTLASGCMLKHTRPWPWTHAWTSADLCMGAAHIPRAWCTESAPGRKCMADKHAAFEAGARPRDALRCAGPWLAVAVPQLRLQAAGQHKALRLLGASLQTLLWCTHPTRFPFSPPCAGTGMMVTTAPWRSGGGRWWPRRSAASG